MGTENLLIMQGLEKTSDGIDQLDSSLLKGVFTIALFLVSLWLILYFLGWQGFNGHWKRSLLIVGFWLFLEFAYFVGGGHSSHR